MVSVVDAAGAVSRKNSKNYNYFSKGVAAQFVNKGVSQKQDKYKNTRCLHSSISLQWQLC